MMMMVQSPNRDKQEPELAEVGASGSAEPRRSARRSKYVKTQHVEALWCQNRGIRFLKKQNKVYILIRNKDSSRALQGPPQEGEKAGGGQRSKNATCVKSVHHRHDQKFQRGQKRKKVASSLYNAYENMYELHRKNVRFA